MTSKDFSSVHELMMDRMVRCSRGSTRMPSSGGGATATARRVAGDGSAVLVEVQQQLRAVSRETAASSVPSSNLITMVLTGSCALCGFGLVLGILKINVLLRDIVQKLTRRAERLSADAEQIRG